MTQGALLAEQLIGTREWTLKLIEDLEGDDWAFQPANGIAHPLWLCGHLATAQNTLIHTRCLGTPVLDESYAAHFPIGEPVKSAGEYDFPSAEVVLANMAETQTRTIEAVRDMSDEWLGTPACGAGGDPHPHYHNVRGAVSHCCRHEAFHAGQIATIRRLLGKPFLR